MTTITTTAIILAVLLGAAALLATIAIIRNNVLRDRLRSVRGQLANMRLGCNDQHPRYVHAPYLNSWHAVWRRSATPGEARDILVRLYTDDDEAYNIIRAEELCDMLNAQ